MVTPEDEAHKPGDDVAHISGEDVNKPSDLETGGKYDKPDENNKHKKPEEPKNTPTDDKGDENNLLNQAVPVLYLKQMILNI